MKDDNVRDRENEKDDSDLDEEELTEKYNKLNFKL